MKNRLERLPRPLRGALFHILQVTWCLPQNVVGAVVSLFLRGERYRYHGALVTLYRGEKRAKKLGAFSLSAFIFVPACWPEHMRRGVIPHEYGHTVQSLIMGPLYLLLVGLPSAIWANVYGRRYKKYAVRGVQYTSRYPERGADRLGERFTGEKPY